MVNCIIKPRGFHILWTYPRDIAGPVLRVGQSWSPAAKPSSEIAEYNAFPLPLKPGQADLAGEELLHRGLLEVALLGDEPVERGDECVDTGERGGDGTLLNYGRNLDLEASEGALIYVYHRRAN